MNPVPAAEVAARDAFLAIVAEKLGERVSALHRTARRTPGRSLVEPLDSLVALVRELGVIAAPRRPVPLRLRRLDLGACLVRFVRSFSEHARAGVRIDVTRGGRVIGRWDPDHLATIFGELFSNAMKHGGGHPVTATLAVRGARVRLTVTNQGGFDGPPRFARFRRGAGAERHQGFGIGLWLTRRLAEAHGGAFRIRARHGATQAVVTLPIERAAGPVSRFRLALIRRPRA